MSWGDRRPAPEMPDGRPPGGGGWKVALGLFLLWTLIGLVEVVPNYVQSRLANEGWSLGFLVIRVLPRWYLWAALTPLVLWLGRTVRPDGSWKRFLAVHGPAGVVVTLVHVVVWWGIRTRFFPAAGVSDAEVLESLLLMFFPLDLMVYWAILAGYLTVTYHGRAREHALRLARLDLRNSRLEQKLTEARLSALSARLQPHFLFNALNAVAELVHKDPERAEETVVRLADVLRMVLRRTEAQRVSLAKELELVETYLSIEEARYRERLRTRIEVPDALLGARVPTLSIQPLVENAVRHGVGRVTRPVTVEVSAVRRDARLVVEVRDDGPGAAEEVREGVGMTTTRERLRELYGDDFVLDLRDRGEGGAVARLEIPLERGPASEE